MTGVDLWPPRLWLNSDGDLVITTNPPATAKALMDGLTPARAVPAPTTVAEADACMVEALDQIAQLAISAHRAHRAATEAIQAFANMQTSIREQLRPARRDESCPDALELVDELLAARPRSDDLKGPRNTSSRRWEAQEC